MKIRTFFLLLVFGCFIVSCSEYSDYYETLNKTPKLSLNSQGELFDTLKVGYSRSYELLVTDEEQIGASFSQTGNDSVAITPTQVVVIAKKMGDNRIILRARDSYNKEAFVNLYLHTFEYLAPIAVLKISGNQNIELDASNSYDKDSGFGGTIVRYRFSIAGFVIDDNLSKVNYIFETSGVKLIKLKVQDNDGLWSNEISINHIVN